MKKTITVTIYDQNTRKISAESAYVYDYFGNCVQEQRVVDQTLSNLEAVKQLHAQGLLSEYGMNFIYQSTVSSYLQNMEKDFVCILAHENYMNSYEPKTELSLYITESIDLNSTKFDSYNFSIYDKDSLIVAFKKIKALIPVVVDAPAARSVTWAFDHPKRNHALLALGFCTTAVAAFSLLKNKPGA